MILYKKDFPLGNDVSFLQYITALRKAYFPNFVVTIDKILSTENYQAQIFFTAPLWKWGLANAFREGVLLKECTIYSNDEKHFTIQASAKTVNLFIASSYVIGAILLFIFALFMIVTKNTMSFNNITALMLVTIVILAPVISVYLRDKKFLDKVGSLETEIQTSNTLGIISCPISPQIPVTTP